MTSPRPLPAGGDRTPAKTERNAALRASRLAGTSIKRLAREYGISVTRVSQLTARLGIPPRREGRPVMVGDDRYDTVTAAALAAGITQGAGSKRAAAGRHGWRYLGLLAAACCGNADAHDFYSGLKAPDGGSCCSDTMHECHPTSMCRLADGKEGIVTEGWGCTAIPWGKVLGAASPDGRPSVCESPIHGPSPVIYCVILGGEA